MAAPVRDLAHGTAESSSELRGLAAPSVRLGVVQSRAMRDRRTMPEERGRNVENRARLAVEIVPETSQPLSREVDKAESSMLVRASRRGALAYRSLRVA